MYCSIIYFAKCNFNLGQRSSGNSWNEIFSNFYDVCNNKDASNTIQDDDERFMSDVTFVLEDDDGVEVKLRAHKLLLSLRSEVFRTMFHGALREGGDNVKVSDVHPRAFEAMLSYVYKGENCAEWSVGGVSGASWLACPSNAWQLWYVAKKYMMDQLEEKCRMVKRSARLYSFLRFILFLRTTRIFSASKLI